MTLTKRLLDALEEALNARLAGGLEDALDQRDYEDALRWVRTQMADRKRNKKYEAMLSRLRIQRDAAAARGHHGDALILNERVLQLKERNSHVAEPFRTTLNQFLDRRK